MKRAGIIAAGRGQRLQQRAGAVLKPLVHVGGRALIDWTLASIGETSPDQVTVIINDEAGAVRDHAMRTRWPFDLQWIVETTPSSMHSFLRVLEALSGDRQRGPFPMATVDTVAPAGAFGSFAARAVDSGADVVLAVTRAIDADRPLLVDVGPTMQVLRIGESCTAGTFCTAGWYSAGASALAEADAARGEGLSALRQFLARLLARGYRLAAVEVPPCVDVDRPDDIGAAEALVKQVQA